MLIGRLLPAWTQDVNWTYIRRSENDLDVFWSCYVCSIYVLCPVWFETKQLFSSRNSMLQQEKLFCNICYYIQFSVLIYQFSLIYSVFCFDFWTPAIVEMPCMNSLLLFRTSVRLFICNARSRKFLIIFFCSFFSFFARS